MCAHLYLYMCSASGSYNVSKTLILIHWGRSVMCVWFALHTTCVYVQFCTDPLNICRDACGSQNVIFCHLCLCTSTPSELLQWICSNRLEGLKALNTTSWNNKSCSLGALYWNIFLILSSEYTPWYLSPSKMLNSGTGDGLLAAFTQKFQFHGWP